MQNISYRKTLEPVIASSSFTVDPGTYIYASVREVHDAEKHLQVINDGKELTIVTDISNLPLKEVISINNEQWKMISIRCGNPFYCVGFIAYISDTLAVNGIDMVITSTFTYDLVMVMERDLERAQQALVSAGFKQGLQQPVEKAFNI